HNMPDFLILSGLFPKLLGAKVILDLHDPMPELMRTIFGIAEKAWAVRLLKWVERRSMAIADSIVTVSQTFATLFCTRSCSSHKITVVMNSPDEKIFQVRPAAGFAGSPALEGENRAPTRQGIQRMRKKRFVIMYHGSLVERNGPDLAVEALARVRVTIPEAELRIYGSPTPFLHKVMDSVRTRGLEKSVQYLGPRLSEQIAEAIRECDLGIIPNQRNI